MIECPRRGTQSARPLKPIAARTRPSAALARDLSNISSSAELMGLVQTYDLRRPRLCTGD